MKIKIKKLRPGARVPSFASPGSAGCDLYACIEQGETVVAPHSCAKICTGIAAAIPEGYFGAVFARSGLASKQGLRPANCVGVCDSDYRGEYIVALFNDSGEPRSIRDGDRIAQLVILPCVSAEFEQVDELDNTERGAGGFGSTGK
jgi:dUTP pyrophosphatase